MGKKDRRTSVLWTYFSIKDPLTKTAECGTCGQAIRYGSTVSNLKHHMKRKHPHVLGEGFKRPVLTSSSKNTGASTSDALPKFKKLIAPSPRVKRTLTELGGLDGLILNVVGEDGEDPSMEVTDEDGNPVKGQLVFSSDVHDYCGNENQDNEEVAVELPSGGNDRQWEEKDNSRRFPQPGSKNHQRKTNDQVKRSQIMDLQMECLEIKRYTMQMEALLLERQLNLPRSIFTERLKSSDTYTRGTQTDMGGNNTKVFYVLDNPSGSTREGGQHLFTFRARTSEDD